jgi:hypothetical protein
MTFRAAQAPTSASSKIAFAKSSTLRKLVKPIMVPPCTDVPLPILGGRLPLRDWKNDKMSLLDDW